MYCGPRMSVIAWLSVTHFLWISDFLWDVISSVIARLSVMDPWGLVKEERQLSPPNTTEVVGGSNVELFQGICSVSVLVQARNQADPIECVRTPHKKNKKTSSKNQQIGDSFFGGMICKNTTLFFVLCFATWTQTVKMMRNLLALHMGTLHNQRSKTFGKPKRTSNRINQHRFVERDLCRSKEAKTIQKSCPPEQPKLFMTQKWQVARNKDSVSEQTKQKQERWRKENATKLNKTGNTMRKIRWVGP